MPIALTRSRMAKKKPARLKRDSPVTFMATADEKRQYEEAGENADLSMSDWIRKTLRVALERLNQDKSK